MAQIGDPLKKIHVEPLTIPVPQRAPVQAPQQAPTPLPEKVPVPA